MGLVEIFLIGVGLAMDAFAVSICKGLNMKKINYKNMIIIALFFGVFQGVMPLLGWLVGSQFEKYIKSFDHWIAFILLVFIGVKMIYETLRKDDNIKEDSKLDYKELLILAIATSIDALAVGLSFAFLQVDIIISSIIIAIVTFLISLIGVIIGNKFGIKYKSKAEITGGIILILIGCKILLEHLFG